MEELLEILGLDEPVWENKEYNKYAERLRNDADKLRMVWSTDSLGDDNSISTMFGVSRNL
jgi:hypothetical protein